MTFWEPYKEFDPPYCFQKRKILPRAHPRKNYTPLDRRTVPYVHNSLISLNYYPITSITSILTKKNKKITRRQNLYIALLAPYKIPGPRSSPQGYPLQKTQIRVLDVKNKHRL